MGRLSDLVMQDLLDAYFGNQATDIPANIYVGLSTTAPSNNGGTVNEPTVGNYARVQVANNTINWNTAANRATSNKTQIVFPTATASWGTLTHFVLYRDPVAATTVGFIGWGELTSPVTVSANGTADFPAGSLVITAPGA